MAHALLHDFGASGEHSPSGFFHSFSQPLTLFRLVKSALTLAALTLIAGTCTATAAVSLTTIGTAYTQDFDTLAATGTSSTLPTGWFIHETGSNANIPTFLYTAGTGGSNAGDNYSFGLAGVGERALGGLLSGSLTPLFGAEFINNTGGTITSLDVAYTGEMWRLGALNRQDQLDFQFSVDATSLTTGTWIDLNTLDFVAPVTTGSTGALDGNLAVNQLALSSIIGGLTLASNATIWLRWTDLNASGADDGLAVDNFSITPLGASHPTPEAGLGTVLTGLVLCGLLLVARSLRQRAAEQKLVPCRVAESRG